MSHYNRDSREPDSETPLTMARDRNDRQERRGGPAPVTLLFSLVLLAVAAGGVFWLYRGGFRGPSGPPQPVGVPIRLITTSNDVIHSWAVPAFWIKLDAIPGRLNETSFTIDKPGLYFGQCSELCGARHAFMPIEVKVVSDADYAAWLAAAKKKFAALDVPTRVAAK